MSSLSAWSTFSLPRLGLRLNAAEVGFFKESAKGLGGPVKIVDPSWTRPPSEAGVIRHLTAHQQLLINTHFGLLTQLITSQSKSTGNQLALTACIEEQWSVQEVAGITAEMTLIAAVSPELLKETINQLPSANMGEPPYLEIFEAARSLVPIETGQAISQSSASYDLVLCLAAFALQSRCLIDLEAQSYSDTELAAYIRANSPHRRLESIVTALGPAALRHLHAEAASALTQANNDGEAETRLMARLMAELHRRLPKVPYERFETLQAQGRAAVSRMKSDGQETIFLENHEVSAPEYIDSEDKQRALRAFFDRVVDQQPDLPTWLKQAAATGGAIHLILRDIDPEDMCSFAVTCMTMAPQRTGPDDLRLTMHAGDILAAFETYPQWPHAVSFAASSWIDWYSLFGQLGAHHWVSPRMAAAARICVHRRLAKALVALLLQFEDIGIDARAFIFRIAPSRYVGCAHSPSNPGAYCMQAIRSEGALALFQQTLEELGVQMEDTPESVPHYGLLRWIAGREFLDPPDFGKEQGHRS